MSNWAPALGFSEHEENGTSLVRDRHVKSKTQTGLDYGSKNGSSNTDIDRLENDLIFDMRPDRLRAVT